VVDTDSDLREKIVANLNENPRGKHYPASGAYGGPLGPADAAITSSCATWNR
jgi:hypothetical protein